MTPVKFLSRQESNQGQLKSRYTKNREKDTCLYYSKLELGEEAHKEIHKETHLLRARVLSVFPHCGYRQWPWKHWPPPLHPGSWSHTPALPTSIGWVGFRRSLVSPGDPAPAWPNHPPKNKRRGVQLHWEKESKTKRKERCRKKYETKEDHP